MSAISIPPPTQQFTQDEFITDPWYRVMTEISRLRTDLDNLTRLTKGMGALDVSVSAAVTFIGTEA